MKNSFGSCRSAPFFRPVPIPFTAIHNWIHPIWNLEIINNWKNNTTVNGLLPRWKWVCISPAICAPVVLRYISTPKHPRALWQTFSFSIATVVADNRRQSWNTSEKWWGEGSKDDDDDGVDDDYRAMNTEDEELVTGLGIDEETRRVTAASSQCRHNAPGWRQSLLGMCGFSVFTSC